jgi:pimeloyl-ACP methyl ester carboxylesterase
MMQAHTLQIGQQTINYYESAGTGPAALLIHGNSLSGLGFRHQIAGELGAQYRIVAIDLPGHGLSSPAADPQQAYTLPGYAAIVLEVVERLELQNAVIVGWSLGGHVVMEAADRLKDAAGLMIFGAPPLGIPPAMAEAFLPNPALGAIFKADLTAAEIDAFVTALFRPDAHENGQVFATDVRRTDPQARAVLAGSIGPGGYHDEIEAVAQLSCPLAVLHGAHEQLVNLAYLQALTIPTLWRGTVQIVPDAGHTPHWEQPRHFNALLDAFLAETATA